MAFTNLEEKKIFCKVLYLGIPSAGISSNFQSIYRETAHKLNQSRLICQPEQPAFFEFLPIGMGDVLGFEFRLHLFSAPLQSLYQTSQSLLFKGVDAVVFVIDSRVSVFMENVQFLSDAPDIFSKHGSNLLTLPRVYQFNKRDHNEALPIEVLRSELNPGKLPDVEACAHKNLGTMECLVKVSGLLIDQLVKQQYELGNIVHA